MTGLQFRGISDDGSTIVGMGNTSGGQFRGFILSNLTAVPEPASLTFAGSSIALLLLRRRKS